MASRKTTKPVPEEQSSGAGLTAEDAAGLAGVLAGLEAVMTRQAMLGGQERLKGHDLVRRLRNRIQPEAPGVLVAEAQRFIGTFGQQIDKARAEIERRAELAAQEAAEMKAERDARQAELAAKLRAEDEARRATARAAVSEVL